jgi:hypothetical protein
MFFSKPHQFIFQHQLINIMTKMFLRCSVFMATLVQVAAMIMQTLNG